MLSCVPLRPWAQGLSSQDEAAGESKIRGEAATLRAYPNNRVVMRPSEKFEAKAAGQKCSEAWFAPR